MRREREGLPPLPPRCERVQHPHKGNSKARKKARREAEMKASRIRVERMQAEVASMDSAILGTVFSERIGREYEPWAGPPSLRPIGDIDLSTSYPKSREKCAGEAYIYGISDPRDHVIRYVGKTQNTLAQRLWEHEFSPSNARVGAWLRQMRADGVTPEITVLEICLKYRWKLCEEFWIAALSSKENLLNISIGGRFDDPRNRKGKAWKRAKARFDEAKAHGQIRFPRTPTV